MAVANGHHSYQPPVRLQQFENDMATITMFLADKDDTVLCPKHPDEQFLSFWKRLGKQIPQFRTATEITGQCTVLIPEPWGYSRAAIFNLERLGIEKQNFPASLQNWLPEHRSFFSRETSARFETGFQKSEIPSFCTTDSLPIIFTDNNQLEEYTNNTKQQLVIKSLWSSSGRGVVMIRKPEHIKPALIWAKGKIRHEGAVIVEELMGKLADFSFQFRLLPGNEVNYLGVNYFATDGSGKFDKELIGTPAIFSQLINDNHLPADWEEQCVETLIREIKQMNWHHLYEGILGFDAMIIRNKKGEIKVRCCVEINFRHNMGMINMALKEFLHPDARGEWRIEQFETGSWPAFYDTMMQKHPLIIEKGKMRSGFMPLTPALDGMIYGVWGMIE